MANILVETVADLGTRGVWRKVRDDTGAELELRRGRITPPDTAETLRAQWEARAQASRLEDDREQIRRDVFDGVDIDAKHTAGGYIAVNAVQARRIAGRTIARRMRDPDDDLQRDEDLAAAEPWFDSQTNGQLANNMSGPKHTWTAGEIGNLKTRLDTLLAGRAQVDHGIEVDDD